MLFAVSIDTYDNSITNMSNYQEYVLLTVQCRQF
jgi:hypothetical protein